jgi:hypothetical protein
MNDVLDDIKRPKLVTVERLAYVAVRNDVATDGLWRINGKATKSCTIAMTSRSATDKPH